MSECEIKNCQHEVYAEGVCLWHYPLWETWGYEGGYALYEEYGREKGSKVFELWLSNLTHQQIVNILTNYDWKLTQAVNEAVASISPNEVRSKEAE